MSRKIDEALINAIAGHRDWQGSNTSVQIDAIQKDTLNVRLHGSLIARVKPKVIEWTLAGYNTNVTRNRVHAILCEFSADHGVGCRNAKPQHIKALRTEHRTYTPISASDWVKSPRKASGS